MDIVGVAVGGVVVLVASTGGEFVYTRDGVGVGVGVFRCGDGVGVRWGGEWGGVKKGGSSPSDTWFGASSRAGGSVGYESSICA